MNLAQALRAVLLMLCFVLLAPCFSMPAQQPKKFHRIGYLSSSDPVTESPRSEGIRLALRDAGYIEGQNIAIEYRYAEGKLDRLPELSAELVRFGVAIILVPGGAIPITSARNATKTIPIVVASSPVNLVEAGLVQSLARPGGNITGITSLSAELGGKRLELLKEAVPKVALVAVFKDDSPGNLSDLKNLPDAARALGLTLQPWEVRAANDFDRVFAMLGKQRPDGVYVPAGTLTRDNRKRIADLALKSRLPSLYTSRDGVEVGGLMSYGADLADIYRRIATYVDKILKGAKPGDLPVEQPKKFELVINLKTAKQITLIIPPNVLARADRVIR